MTRGSHSYRHFKHNTRAGDRLVIDADSTLDNNMMSMRICKTCGASKGRDPYCRPCSRRSAMRWARQYPERRQAHKAVAKARKDGILVKPSTCEWCVEPAAIAHHEDYSKPLQVIWLCDKCHSRRHRRLK